MFYLSGYIVIITFELFSRGPTFKSNIQLFACLESAFPFWSSKIGELQPHRIFSKCLHKKLHFKVPCVYLLENFLICFPEGRFSKNVSKCSPTKLNANNEQIFESATQWRARLGHCLEDAPRTCLEGAPGRQGGATGPPRGCRGAPNSSGDTTEKED